MGRHVGVEDKLQKIRKGVNRELYEALQHIGQATNLLTRHDWHCETVKAAEACKAIKSAEALEQITADMTQQIHSALTRR